MYHHLAHDILLEIFRFLDLRDLLNVSLACRSFERAASVYIYREIQLTWDDIERITQQKGLNDRRLRITRKIRIGVLQKSEWIVSSRLPMLIEMGGNRLQGLEIAVSSRSSAWLKYLSIPLFTITNLELIPSSSFCWFAFNHVAVSLPNLESISLGNANQGFFIDPLIEGGCQNLRHIKVENCEWQYPAKLSDAAENTRLESLEIRLSHHMHPFAFSERLRTELAHLPASLKYLKLTIMVGTRLTWNPLQLCNPLEELRSVSLEGFQFAGDRLQNIDKVLKFPKLESISQC